MGTEITLELAGLTLSWSKNSRGIDHGALFQEADRKRVRSDGIDYDYYADRDDAELAKNEMAFGRLLGDTTPRLELLGHTLHRVRREYDAAAAYWREREQWDEDAVTPDVMSFDEFCAFLQAHPVRNLDDTFSSSLDDREVRGRFADDPAVARLPGYSPYDRNAYSERSYFGSLVNILDPYSGAPGPGVEFRERGVRPRVALRPPRREWLGVRGGLHSLRWASPDVLDRHRGKL